MSDGSAAAAIRHQDQQQWSAEDPTNPTLTKLSRERGHDIPRRDRLRRNTLAQACQIMIIRPSAHEEKSPEEFIDLFEGARA